MLSEKNKIEKTTYTVILYIELKVKVAESCTTLEIPWIVPGILQVRILEWWVAFPFSRGSSQPRSVLQADSLPAEPQGKPKNTGVGSLSLSSRSSWPRNWTWVSCISGEFFISWAIREAPFHDRWNQIKGNGCQEMRMVFITGERSLKWGRDMQDL